MAIKLVDEYVNATSGDADYPGGSFKNATSGAGVDGTPLEKAWANDWLGFFQKLLAESETIPSGAPDTAVSSQYYDALMELVGELVTTHAAVTNSHGLTSAATASRGILRDANARAQVADPAVAADIATMGYVDGLFRASFKSTEIAPIVNGTDYSFAHGFAAAPRRAHLALRCTADDVGFVVGDWLYDVTYSQDGLTGGNAGFVSANDTHVFWRGYTSVRVLNPDTGAYTTLTISKWSGYLMAEEA